MRVDPTLSVEDLCTYFFTSRGVIKAVDGVTFEVAREEIVGLVGETGSGKSVTAASIMGIVRPPGQIVRGRIRFDGREITRMAEQEIRRLRGSQIAMVVQNPRAALNPLIPVGDQILNVYRTHLNISRREAEARMCSILEGVGFSEPRSIARSYVHQLSGGMAQRVIIAIAMGTSPKLVIADEPTTGLDATVQVEVLDLMIRLIRQARAAMLLITHDLGIVAQYCDSVAVMHSGVLVERADIETFFTRPSHAYSSKLLNALKSQTPPPVWV
jgi:ABC-type dipeptide/oligopeptide/nickel transport system ATPase component